MACNPSVLRQVPLFALLDDEETAVLASQVGHRNFRPRQRIYRIGEPGGRAYVLVSGSVRITTVDEDGHVDTWRAGAYRQAVLRLSPTPARTPAEPFTGRPERVLDTVVEAQIHGLVILDRDVEMLVADPAFAHTSMGQSLVKLAETYGLDLH